VHRVEFVRLSEVVGADRNAKLHSTGDLKASIRRFGFVAPLLRNALNGKLVAGHGRTEALREQLDAALADRAALRERANRTETR